MVKKTIINPDSHIFLYAKGWYKRSKNQFDDLRKVLSHRNGVASKHISDWDILEVLGDIVFPFIAINSYKFGELIKDILDPSGYNRRYSLKTKVLMGYLRIINLTQVKEDGKILISLGKPDYNILPKKVD